MSNAAKPKNRRERFTAGTAARTAKVRVEINPKVMMGKPVIRGTRVPVELLLRKLSEGETKQELLQDYPFLKLEDIRAARNWWNLCWQTH